MLRHVCQHRPKAFWPVLMWKGNVRVFNNFVRLEVLSLWEIDGNSFLFPALVLRPESGTYLIHLNRGQTDGRFYSRAPRKKSPIAKQI